MKKKQSSVGFLGGVNILIVAVLWVVSAVLSVYLLIAVGGKLNRPIDKNHEKKYKHTIDILCYIVIATWCVALMINGFYNGPMFVAWHAYKNMMYIALTIATMVIWFKRSYLHNKHARNFLVVVSWWYLILYALVITLGAPVALRMFTFEKKKKNKTLKKVRTLK